MRQLARGNPIIVDKGVCDPHIHVFRGRLYLYAGVDDAWDSVGYVMKEWQVWSSDNLRAWRLAGRLKPEDTYMGPSTHCWAGDAAERNGRYYWYFSNGSHDIGVAAAAAPEGPFRDALGRPLIAAEDVPGIPVYDPDLFTDDDAARTPYILFGAFSYQIARLAECMTALAEPPRAIVIEGAPALGDKVGLFKRQGVYYLQWGTSYAMADNVYGPYRLAGAFSDGGHAKPFFWNNQWYVGKVEKDCQFYRSTSINYLRFREDGTIVCVSNDPLGVGQYDAARPRISFADYYACSRAACVGNGEQGGLAVRNLPGGSQLEFPGLLNLPAPALLHVRYRHDGSTPVLLDVNGRDFALQPTKGYVTVCGCVAAGGAAGNRLLFTIQGDDAQRVSLAWFSFNPAAPAPRLPVKEWDFSTSNQGWTAIRDTTLEWRPPGYLCGALHGPRALIQGPVFSIADLDANKSLIIRLCNQSPATHACLWWDVYGTAGLSNPHAAWDERRSVTVDLVARDTHIREYRISLAQARTWTGLLKQLRLELRSDSADGSWMLDSICLLP